MTFRRLVDEVRERTDLVKLIGEDGALEPCGSVMKGRSPWNRDEHPSFVVWPHTQTWKDFSGSGDSGGDCFTYVQRRDGVAFMEALQSLAARAGVDLPGRLDPDVEAELDRLSVRRRVEGLLTAAAAYYHHVLPTKVRETWYRDHYGFTDETVDRLLLGWADGHLFEHLTGLLGATRDEALATGLFVRFSDGRVEDFFRDRLVFPYWMRGRVVYFIARATEHTGDEPWEQSKYKKLLTHSERHPYVSEYVANDTLYNEDVIRGGSEVLITEGVTDCISAIQAGVTCVSPVTTRFRQKDVPKLVSLTERARRIIICNDSEASGSGEAGALETARALHAAGRDVRIATIPLPEGQEKIDVNELVARQGPDALKRVLSAAKRYPAFLIERIPADTPKEDLAAALVPVLDLVRAAEPLERDAYLDLLQRRFRVRAMTLRALLRPRQKEGKPKPEPFLDDRLPPDARKGQVFEETDHYFVLGADDQPVAISSFQIEPRLRILVEGGEIIDADVTTDGGRAFTGVRFPREAWQSKREFMRVFKPIDLQWTGSDENVQGVLRLIASRKVPTRRGTTCLGYVETPEGSRWVTPSGVLAPLGVAASDDDIVYVSSGASLPGRVSYRPPSTPGIEAAAAAVVLPNILRLNTPEVVLPILGWFFAAPLKPRVQKALGHFPILVIHGTQGSGKSSMVMDVFWPLLGVTSSEPYSATETEFALLKLLSATNSVPVFIDEYKPYDMMKLRRNTLHRYMRRLYTGEDEERGRADQTTVTYHLSAPLCIAGETRPIEPALVERILTANPDKNELMRSPEYARALAKIKTVDLGTLSAGIVRFLLGRDTAADLLTARAITDSLLEGREVPFRVRDNLVVMVMGLHHFEEYAQSLGIALPDMDLAAAVEAILADLLEEGGRAVKVGIDYFLEELSAMAVSGKVQHGQQYAYDGTLLALHLPSCHAAFAEHCSRMAYEGEVPDRKAVRRQAAENCRRGGYVREVDALVCFNGRGDRRRSVLVDLEEAKRLLMVDDFPKGTGSGSSSSYGSGRGWQQD